MYIRQCNGVVLLLVGFLGWLLVLALQEPLPQHTRVLAVLLALSVKAQIEFRLNVRLPLPVAAQSLLQPVNDHLVGGNCHFAHPRCLAHLMQLVMLQIVHLLLLLLMMVHQGLLLLLHQLCTLGALRGLTGQETPGLHTAPQVNSRVSQITL